MKTDFLDKLIEKQYGISYPGVGISVRIDGDSVFRRVYAHRQTQPTDLPTQFDSIYDMASVTKSLATSLLIFLSIDSGNLSFDTTAGSVLPDIHPTVRDCTVQELLSHTAGLPALPDIWPHFPDSEKVDTEKALALLMNVQREWPRGRQVVYSCTGFLILGQMLKTTSGLTLSEMFSQSIASPLGLTSSGFRPTPDLSGLMKSSVHRLTATEFCPWRNRWVIGEVHDENAFCFGGDSGNAGLFSTLDETATLVELWRNQGIAVPQNGGAPFHLIRPETLRKATHCNTEGMAQRRGLGIQFNSEDAAGGPAFGPGSFGHTGFTGPHFWIVPELKLSVTVLCSRLQYGRDETLEPIKRFRHELHTAISAELNHT